MAAALSAHLWFLDRAGDDKIGKNYREVDAAPLLDFRQSPQANGTAVQGTGASARSPTPAQRCARRDINLFPGKAVTSRWVPPLLTPARFCRHG